MGKYIACEKRYENMVYNRCGTSGLKLPAVSLGMWHNFGKKENFENMKKMCFAAFDSGITHFDLANNYGFPYIGSAEENMGKILSENFREYRNELVISTKAGFSMWPGPYGDFGSRKYLISSLDDSLRRLKLDYVDIFYHHRPDPETPLEETMGALAQIVKSGKAIYAGLSNYDGEGMERAAEILNSMGCPFIINQNRYSILYRQIEENGILKSAEKLGKGMIIFSPLAQGLLTDKYLKEIPENSRIKTSGIFLKESSLTPEIIEKVKALNELAQGRGETLAQMSLAWVLNKKAVTSVLIGASSPEQIMENAKVAQSKPFSEEELAMIDKIALG
ncbi:MAG: aldo/keto reductase [Monoglobales bacterium]